MSFKKVIYVFFTLMSLTTTAGFLYDPNSTALFIAASVNIISTLLKIGTTNTLSAELMSGSLVADLHLIPAFVAYEVLGNYPVAYGLAIGAVIANFFTTCLIIIEASKLKVDDNEY